MRRNVVSAAAVWALLALAARAAEPPVFDVPRVDGVAIDGALDDWGEGGFRVDCMVARNGLALPVDDFDPRFRLGWNRQGLLVGVEVRDDMAAEAEEEYWTRDSIEIFMAAERGSPQFFQLLISPGVGPAHPELRTRLYDKRAERPAELVQRSARRLTDGGYACEVLLPWTNVGVPAEVGRLAAFQIYVADADLPEEGTFQAVWYPYEQAHANPWAYYPIRLAEKPSPPVEKVVTLYEDAGTLELRIVGAPALAGQAYALTGGGRRAVARGRLAEEGGRAAARHPLPMPQWKVRLGGEAPPVVPRRPEPHFSAY